MNTLKKLWQGKYSLAKSFWLFGVAILLLLNIPNGVIGMMSDKALAESRIFIIAYMFFIGTYQFIVTFGVWKASSSYKGAEIWEYISKAYCVVTGLFQLMGVVAIFKIGALYGLSYIGLWMLTAYWLDKSSEDSKSSIQPNIFKKDKVPQVQAINSKQVDDESLWEAASKELAENKREGLWAKCFAEANGNDSLAKVAYLKSRVQQLNEGLIQKPLVEDAKHEISKVNAPLKSIIVKREYKELKGATPFDQNLTYTDLSVKNLLESGMYAVEKYEKKDLLFFYNGYVGCVNGSLVKVFETEDLCKKAIKDGMASSKYPQGLIVTIDKDTFDVY